jgi:aspartate/methionine/tyrosine aminotransferase
MMNISPRLSSDALLHEPEAGLIDSAPNSEPNPYKELSYAQWVRRSVKDSRDAFILFDSSVDEPKALLQQTIRSAFDGTVSDRYTSAFVGGNPFLLKALARRYDVPTDYILTTSAATTAISLVYNACLTTGDHILLETPHFDLLRTPAISKGINVELFERTGDDFAIDTEGLRLKIRPNTRLIVLSDLHNPSGMLVPEATMRALAAIAEDYDLKVIIDEVYGDYAEGARVKSAVHYSKNFITINSLTKIYGLSTLRCGWMLGAPETLAPVRAYADRFDFTTSNLAHAIAALVLEDDVSYDAYRRRIMMQTRPVMAAQLEAWTSEGLMTGQLPEFGCICFPRLVGIDDTIAFSDWLAKTHKVRVAPGEYFGKAGHVRIGFAKETDGMSKAFERLTQGLREYRR